MPKSITLIKAHGGLVPATQSDLDTLGGYKLGQGIRADLVSLKPRSLQHHKKYWVLVDLAFDYWEPEGGLVSASEIATLKSFTRWLDSKTDQDTKHLENASKQFLSELAQRRGLKIEAPTKDREALHKWIKVEANHCTYEITPTGVRKSPLSINFNSMSQDDFNGFYKQAFSVVWRFILSRAFNTEAEAEQALDKLLIMDQ